MSSPDNSKLNGFSENIQPEHVENAISRCYNMLDYISDSAANIITDIIYNSSCSNVKQFLVLKPEELAVKAFKKVLGNFDALQYEEKDVH